VLVALDIWRIEFQMNTIPLPQKSRQTFLFPWTEPDLGTVDEFVLRNPLYPACIVTVYQIVRDLHIKQEVTDITIIDGSKWQRNEYFLQARTRTSGGLRLMIPFYLDSEIDLPWLVSCQNSFDVACCYCVYFE
jgi:predicted deacylase